MMTKQDFVCIWHFLRLLLLLLLLLLLQINLPCHEAFHPTLR